jgi:UDP-2,4-diacetamido-2,4,6-trideoxy-beta-L-altropyranose hydrolase
MTVPNLIKVCFRLDASNKIGAGHLRRCLVLAQALKPYVFQVTFACRALQENAYPLVERQGFVLHLLEAQDSSEEGFAEFLQTDAFDLLIVDHYQVNQEMLAKWRQLVVKVMVIDDLANRRLECDLLLDTGLGKTFKDYQGLVHENCNVMIGHEYALIADDFVKLREAAQRKRKQMVSIQRVLVSIGSSDVLNILPSMIERFSRAFSQAGIQFVYVLSEGAQNIMAVKTAVANSKNACLLMDTPNMAEEMLLADYGITASGVTAYERSCLGLPGIVLPIVDNQIHFALGLQKMEWFKVFFDSECFIENVVAQLEKSLKQACLRKLNIQSRTGMDAIDGLGAQRVVKELKNVFW